MDRYHLAQVPTEAGNGLLDEQPVQIKCLIFLLKTPNKQKHPVLFILRITDRVDQAAAAKYFNLSKSSISMAPPDELVSICGFPVGSIPPFGHSKQLFTVVDEAVAARSCVVFGPSLEFIISSIDLLRGSRGSVAAISKYDGKLSDSMGSDTSGNDRGVIPWPPGSNAVSLTGVVVQKRKIAKLLLFCTIIPPSTTSVPKPGSSAFSRSLWTHPEKNIPCEVQLILGKTLERKLGKDSTAELLKSIRVGDTVHVIGKPQDNVEHETREVLDIVVHEITKVRPTHKAASSISPSSLSSSLEEEEHQQQEDASIAALVQQPLQQQQDTGQVLLVQAKQSKKQIKQQKQQAMSLDTSDLYAPSIQPEDIYIVDDLKSLLHMKNTLFSFDSKEKESNTLCDPNPDTWLEKESNTLCDPNPDTWLENERPSVLVGMDAEWQPSSREERHTPVSVLQISTKREAFLVDMLMLCHQNKPVMHPVEEQGGQQCTYSLSVEQKELSDILSFFFGHRKIVKVGFGLRYDLKRLIQSYPWLPCFGGSVYDSQGCSCTLVSSPVSVPIRSHVDALILGRAAGDGTVSFKRMGLSVLCSTVLGKHLDKSEQCSDWNARPLKRSQIFYAVNDACCLVDIYDAIISERPEFASSPFFTQQFESHLTDMSLLWPSYHPGLFPITADTAAATIAPVQPRSGAFRQGTAAFPLTASVRRRGQGTTQQIPCNIDAVSRRLGGPVVGGGKLAVIRLAASPITTDPHNSTVVSIPDDRLPRFPRGSAVLEFCNNVFLLFINVPSVSYPNAFTLTQSSTGDLECRMSWWASKGQTLSHPLIQRLLGTAASLPLVEDGAGDVRRDGGPAVYLFARPKRDAYVCCGRVEPASYAEDEDRQLAVSWRLIDYNVLKTSKYFQNILELQGGVGVQTVL